MTSVERSESPRRAKSTKKAKGLAPVEELLPPLPATDPEGAAANEPDEGDEDPAEGEWLFRHNDTVLGPVTAAVLVDKIKKDELSGDTPIARDGQPFKPMKLFRLFREAIAAREDEKRYAAEERAWRSAVTRTRALRAAAMVVLFAAPAAASVFGARKFVEARPWDDTPKWLAHVPPLVDLPQKPPEVRTSTTTPATVATNTPPDDANAAGATNGASGPDGGTGANGANGLNGAYGAKKPPLGTGKPGDTKLATSTGSTGTATGSTTGSSTGATAPVDDKPDVKPPAGALPETLTNAQAIEPLKGAQADLKACFKAEMESNPEIPAQVVLSYTVTEDGRAINVALDARELRGRPVVACVQKAIAALHWPRFTGERKNVSVPFKLGKPPAKK
jgi:hypothetical protein